MHMTSVNGTFTEDMLLRTTLETEYKHIARPGASTTVYLFYVLRTFQSLVWFSIVYGGGMHMTSVSGTYTEDTLLCTTLQTGYKQTATPRTPTTVYLFYVLRTL